MLETLNPSLGYGGAQLNTRLPRILAELQNLVISGPLTGAGASVAIAVADLGGIDVQDTILKSLIINGSTHAITDDTANVTIVDRRAQGTITLSGFAAGNQVTVDGKIYTGVAFTATPSNGTPPPRSFAIGATDAATAANLAVAIMSGDSTLLAEVLSGAVVTIIAQALGTSGNAVTLDTTLSGGHASKSGATLTGGTVTNAIKTTTNTSGNTILLFWYRKSRVVGQF